LEEKEDTMIVKKISIFFILYFLFSGLLYAGEIKPQINMEYKMKQQNPCYIKVTSPDIKTWCYINQQCSIIWDTSNINNWPTVFISVIQWDKEHPNADYEGGGYPVSNTGNYQWTVPANVGPLVNTAYIIKIITPDHKCTGQSAAFGIKIPTKIENMNIENMKMKKQGN
jgi:hypothetical protein